MEYRLIRFIGEPIEVTFTQPPELEKKPVSPSAFHWRDVNYQVTSVISEWVDYARRGRMAKNMQPAHLSTARKRGSWGVGQFYFRVLTAEGKIFDLYYDRAPRSVDDRKGAWFIDRELAADR
jgi:hypothetical protein